MAPLPQARSSPPAHGATFLDALQEEQRRELRRRATPRRFPRGGALAHTGQVGDRVFVIVSGHVKLTRVTPEGRDVMLALRGPGDLVGEQSAIDGEVRSATITALDAVEALAITPADFLTYVTTVPDAALYVMRTLAERLRDADGKRVEHAAHDVVGAGAVLAQTMPKVYEASASVLVQSVDQDTNAQGGRTKGAVNLDTEAQLVGSGAVAAKAAALMRSDVSPIELARSVSVQVPANTTVLVITFKAETPAGAQAGSHAFAEAYLRNREETARAQLDKQIQSLNLKVKQLTTTLTGINAKLAGARKGSSTESNLLSLRNNSQNQLNSLTGRLNELTTTMVGGGSIISDSRLPEEPTSPNTLLNVGT
ncbi:cyclic nucleotide-binding domain-containing protein, partial [Patulibacter sp. NPDC049589]|uniref:cyclic nucleotide-binding domain-containing protein n=1 Tax=Patulibacter sp. NPDC049589 TaxID=3154731 RepID=UPI003420F355